jgi:ribonuclease J
MKPFLAWLDEHDIPMHKCHTSGHASVEDLKRLRAAFRDAVVVPIHTEQPSLYGDIFGNVRVCPDGVWWNIDE